MYVKGKKKRGRMDRNNLLIIVSQNVKREKYRICDGSSSNDGCQHQMCKVACLILSRHLPHQERGDKKTKFGRISRQE